MTFYQRASLVPTSLRGILSCCYGSREGRPRSPDDRPGSPPADDERDGAGSAAACPNEDSWVAVAADEAAVADAANGPAVSADGTESAAHGARSQSQQPVDGKCLEPPDVNDSDTPEKANGPFQPAWGSGSPDAVDGPRPVGALEIGVRYDCGDRQVTARVVRTHDLHPPGSDLASRWNSVQVSLAMLPARKQRHRTETVKGESPQFGESFVFTNIYASELPRLAIRFRVYGCERKRRKLVVGECTLALAAVASEAAVVRRQEEALLHLPLMPCSQAKSRVGSDTGFSEASSTQAGSCISVMGTAELFLGLSYNAKTGQLAVEVLKGSGFRMPGSSRVPETIVKMSLMASTSQILFKSKTSFAAASPNPMWKESFMFPVNRFQLSDVTIVVSIYAKKSINRREMIGWFAVGRNSSGEEESAHWQDMLDAKAEQVSHWHRLLHPDEKK